MAQGHARWAWLIWGAVIALTGSGCVGAMQQRMIFDASRAVGATPADVGLVFEDVRLSVAGEMTHGWFVPQEEARAVVLFSHGNSGNLSREIESIQRLRSFGLSVLAYDYGGYGESTGRPSEARCYADIQAMWAYLTVERGIPADEIALFGRSLGCGPTLELAQGVEPAAVILESPFLSIADMARETKFKSVAGLVRRQFDNEAKIGKISCPVLIVHSPEDEIVPFEHGLALYELAPAPKHFLEVSGGHTTSRMIADPGYATGWDAFLEAVFGAEP